MSAGVEDTSKFKQLSIEETFRRLAASPLGLTESEAEIRIGKFGYNEVREERENTLIEFLSRYWGPMPWLLELAIALSFLLGHYFEAAIIFILFNYKRRHRLYTFPSLARHA